MISAYYQDDLLDQTKDLQLSGFVEKPINASALFDVMTGVVGLERMETQNVNRHAKSYQTLSANLRGARVLLVDDNEVNRTLGLDILTQAGLVVDLACDGVEAVMKVTQNAYDAVLMDWQMPVMDGFEATRRIRADARFATLPILAMTANAMSGDKEKCLAVGMNDHIGKPINVKDLLTCLTRWIGKPPNNKTKSSSAGMTALNRADDTAGAWLRIKELKVQEALQRLDGNEALYQKLLDALVQETQVVSQIRQCLRHGETQRALIAAHSLKGLAANLGATELMRAAQTVEKHLQRSPDQHLPDLEPSLQTLFAHLDQLLRAVAALPASTKPDQSSAKFSMAWDTQNLFPLLRELQLLIQSSDATATVCATKLTQLLNGHHAATAFAAISACIRHYDFDQALTAFHAFIADQQWESEMAQLVEAQAQLDQFSAELRSRGELE
ncbi:MAG: response regulator [Burkholderiales bacterium]|nr:response regulator [Burkholderiales bacterium]